MFWDLKWPRLQTLHDLKALARGRLGQARFLEDLTQSGRDDLADQLRRVTQAPELELEPEGEYHELLAELEAAARGNDLEGAAFALALLLADAVQEQVGHGGADFGWLEHKQKIESMPQPWRAALARGYDFALAIQHREGTARPKASLFISEPREAVVTPLVTLARTMSEAMIESIAQADYGSEAAQHAEALRAVLADEFCRFPAGERWYPAEVVELTGHDPRYGATFWPCIALLVLDDIHEGSGNSQMSFRWKCNAENYLSAPEPFRDPILRGIRHVMETYPELMWDPYWELWPQKTKPYIKFVPWFDAALRS